MPAYVQAVNLQHGPGYRTVCDEEICCSKHEGLYLTETYPNEQPAKDLADLHNAIHHKISEMESKSVVLCPGYIGHIVEIVIYLRDRDNRDLIKPESAVTCVGLLEGYVNGKSEIVFWLKGGDKYRISKRLHLYEVREV